MHLFSPGTITSALLATAVLAGGPQGAAASASQTTFFEAPVDLTAPGPLPPARAAALDELAGLGVRALRVTLPWHTVAAGAEEPVRPAGDLSDPASYSWGAFGQVVDDAKRRGWTVLLSPTGPAPRWATAGAVDTRTKPDPAAFEAYATAAARRFGGPTVRWSIWNEPNVAANLMPQSEGGVFVAGRLYRDLFVAGRRGIRSAQPGAQVLFGETAPASRVPGRQTPIAFLRDALCVDHGYRFDARCGKLTLDGVAHHPYRLLPGVPVDGDDVTYATVPRLTTALDRMAAAGAIGPRTEVHLTQFGVQSLPDVNFGVPAQRQLEERARAERIAYEDARVASFSQYGLTDDAPSGPRQWAGSEGGLRYATGVDKPALAAFRLVLDARPAGAGRVSLWGRVRPATGPTRATVERSTGGAFRRLASVRTKADGTFVLRDRRRAGAHYRLRWNGPDGLRTSPAVRLFRH